METKERIPALWKPEPTLRGLDASKRSGAQSRPLYRQWKTTKVAALDMKEALY